jgi:hypothetical protein
MIKYYKGITSNVFYVGSKEGIKYYLFDEWIEVRTSSLPIYQDFINQGVIKSITEDELNTYFMLKELAK